jgi:hypothetical protein
MASNEDEYGFFEDTDNGDIILNYSNQNLPNYKYNINTNDSRKKKRDSYDETESYCLLDTYDDYARRVRFKFLYCIQCCYPIIVVGTLLSLFGWILYAY